MNRPYWGLASLLSAMLTTLLAAHPAQGTSINTIVEDGAPVFYEFDLAGTGVEEVDEIRFSCQTTCGSGNVLGLLPGRSVLVDLGTTIGGDELLSVTRTNPQGLIFTGNIIPLDNPIDVSGFAEIFATFTFINDRLSIENASLTQAELEIIGFPIDPTAPRPPPAPPQVPLPPALALLASGLAALGLIALRRRRRPVALTPWRPATAM